MADRARTIQAIAPPVPRFALAWAALVFALCTLALMYPALGGGFLVNPSSDQFSTGYAYRVFGTTTLQQTGAFAQWNPYILGGLPFVAAQHGDIFYPTFLLRLVLPVDVALTWSFGLHLFLAGLFTYLLLRALGLGFFPSLVGGVGYMLSGQVASLVSPGHDGKMYVSALTPLLLHLIVRGVRDGKPWAWGTISVVTGLMIFTPHFQLTYYAGMLAIGFTLYLAFRRGPDVLERRVAITRVALAGAAAALGFVIASIHFLPFFQYLEYGARGTERGWEYATSWSMPPEELLNAYLPQFSGILERYWGRNYAKLHSDYLGASVLVLAVAAFGTLTRRSLVWFWSIAAVVALLVAFGGRTPFYRLWYLLPMMKVVRAPSMIYFIVSLATAVLAAIGTERLLAGEISRRYVLAWGGAAVAIAVFAALGLFTGLADSLGGAQKFETIRANAPSMITGALRSLLFVGLTLATLVALDRAKLARHVAGAVLVAIAATDLWSIARHYFRFSPPARELYATDPAIEYLKQIREPGRVISLALGGGGARDPVLDGDALMIHRIRAVTGHQGNEIQRWVDLAGAKSPAPPVNFVKAPFRRLANAKYWLTDADLPSELAELRGTRLIKRIGPVRNAAGNTVYLYEFDEDNPAAWIAPVIAEAAPEAIYATVMDPRFDLRRAALFDTSSSIEGVPIAVLPEPLPIRASVTSYEPAHITVKLDKPAPAGSALVVSENFYPGWHATVDGKETPIGRADYTLIGVPLPAGAREVDLAFRVPVYERGKLVTFVALALAALAIVAGVVIDRKARG